MFNKKILSFGIVIAIIVLAFLVLDIIKLKKDVNLLENKIMQLESQYSGAVQNAKDELEEVLKQKESIISSYSFKPLTKKIKNETLDFKVKIVPKVYVEGMSAEFIISGNDTYKYKLNYVDREYVAEIPVNLNETELSFTVCFSDKGHIVSQVIDIEPDVIENYIMRVSYEDDLNISESENKLTISGEIITNYSPIYDSDLDKPIIYPEKGMVIVKRNGVKVLEENIEFRDISDGQYFDCTINQELNTTINDYKKGDTVEVFAKVIDNFGNITEEKIETFK